MSSTILKIMHADKAIPVKEQSFTMHVMAPGQVIAITDSIMMDTNNPASNTKEAVQLALYRQQLVITSPAHEPMRLPITGNVYVINDDGKTISAYEVPMPLVSDYQQAHTAKVLNAMSSSIPQVIAASAPTADDDAFINICTNGLGAFSAFKKPEEVETSAA